MDLNLQVVVVVEWLIMVVFVAIVGMSALVVDTMFVMMTSPPELARCAHPLFLLLHSDYRANPQIKKG